MSAHPVHGGGGGGEERSSGPITRVGDQSGGRTGEALGSWPFPDVTQMKQAPSSNPRVPKKANLGAD